LGFPDLREFQLLMILGLGEGRTVEAVNDTIPAEKGYFSTAMCSNLQRLGLARCTDDGRIWLTDAGRDQIAQGTTAANSLEADALTGLDDAERRALRNLLKRLILQTAVD
jgi:hypothetical protein